MWQAPGVCVGVSGGGDPGRLLPTERRPWALTTPFVLTPSDEDLHGRRCCCAVLRNRVCACVCVCVYVCACSHRKAPIGLEHALSCFMPK